MQNYIIETVSKASDTPMKSYCLYGTKRQVLKLIKTDPRLNKSNTHYAIAPREVIKDYPDAFREARDTPGILIPLEAFEGSTYNINWGEIIGTIALMGVAMSVTRGVTSNL